MVTLSKGEVVCSKESHRKVMENRTAALTVLKFLPPQLILQAVSKKKKFFFKVPYS